MKTLPAEFITQDEKDQRQPVEVFHIWIEGGNHWRYTSADKEVVYNGRTYIPATLKRDSIKYDESLGTMQVNISVGYVYDFVIENIASSPVETVWVQISKIFRDQTPYYASSLFTGVIKNVSFSGLAASVSCSGIGHLFKTTIPKDRFQPTCNEFLFSEKCGLNKEDYCITTVIDAISDNGKSLYIYNAASQLDSYFTWGFIETGKYHRLVVEHVGSNIYLRYPMIAKVGDKIKLYAGCNGTIERCYVSFNNVNNFRGHSNVPIDNPVIWSRNI